MAEASSDRPSTLGALRDSGWVSRPIKQEIREHAIAKVAAGEALFDGAMYAHRPDGTGSEPDGMFNLWETLRSGRVRYLPIEPGGAALTVQGEVDLVMECVSPSSVGKDTVRLRAAYFAAGVREYWILDGRGGGLAFDLLTRTDDADGWTEAAPDADGYRVSPVLDRRVRIDRGTNPVGGVRWDVRLEPGDA